MAASLVFGGPLSPLGWRIGFLRAPYPRVREVTLKWKQELSEGTSHSLEVQDLGGQSLLESLRTLDPLQTPPKRELLVSTRSGWTAHFMNNHLGGDSQSWTGHLSRILGCQSILASHIPRDQYSHPSTQFTVGGDSPRTIGCGKYDSGRWEFFTSGDPLDFEETARYSVLPIRDRFDRPMLIRYLVANGIEPDDPGFWGEATRIQKVAPWESRESTVADHRRKYGMKEAPGEPRAPDGADR
jgi:hypothetical protein